MDSNAEGKENDVDKPIAVGESISLLGDKATEPKGSDGDKGSDGETERVARPRRRQRIGSRLATLRSKVESGNASDDEKREYEQQAQEQASRRDSASAPKEKPPQTGEEKPRVKADWRKKYGDAEDGRERICTTVASYWSTGLRKLVNYIEDGDGDPILDLNDDEKRAEFNSVLVLASDDVLPPDFKLSAAMIAAGGTTTLILQAAAIAYKKREAKAPTKPSVKSDEERVKEETARAKRVVEPPEVEKAQSPVETPIPAKEPDKVDKAKPPRERGVV